MATLEERIANLEAIIALAKKGQDLINLPLNSTGKDILVFNPLTQRVDKIPNFAESKLNRGGYPGTAQDLYDAIISIPTTPLTSGIQEISDNGNTTTNEIISLAGFKTESTNGLKAVSVLQDALLFLASNYNLQLKTAPLNKDSVITLPSKTGTIALLDDLEEIFGEINERPRAYYDKFEFKTGVLDDLSDLSLTSSFSVVRTINGLYFFVSDINNLEGFINSRIYIHGIEMFEDLNQPTITSSSFLAWEIVVPFENYLENSLYPFNFWYREVSQGGFVTVFGNPFQLLKHPNNSNQSEIEVNDIILNGFRNNTTLWEKAQCLSVANINLDASWNVISAIEELPIN